MDELVQVYASGDTFAAELMRGRLEAEDIPVLVKGEGEGPYRMGPLLSLGVGRRMPREPAVIVEAVESGDFALADEEAPAESSESTGERPGLKPVPAGIGASSTAAPCGPSSGRTSGVPSRGRRG